MTTPNILSRIALFAAVSAVMLVVGCGKDETPASPGIQPEIINNVDNFQFQVTAMSNYSGTLQYAWSNTGAMAVIDQACAVSAGTATLRLLDDSGAEVYSKDLSQGGSYTSVAGISGVWSIKIVLSNTTGTLNFRVDKATP